MRRSPNRLLAVLLTAAIGTALALPTAGAEPADLAASDVLSAPTSGHGHGPLGDLDGLECDEEEAEEVDLDGSAADPGLARLAARGARHVGAIHALSRVPHLALLAAYAARAPPAG